MPQNFTPIQRWKSGPKGFRAIANSQLDTIERRLAQVPTSSLVDSRFPEVRRRTTFPAILTGITAIDASAGRWVYDFAEAVDTVTFSSSVPTDITTAVMTGGRTGKALNRAEINNTSATAGGVKMSGDYPAGFAPEPATGGNADQTHARDVAVEMHEAFDAAGNLYYWFYSVTPHDGTCEAS